MMDWSKNESILKNKTKEKVVPEKYKERDANTTHLNQEIEY